MLKKRHNSYATVVDDVIKTDNGIIKMFIATYIYDVFFSHATAIYFPFFSVINFQHKLVSIGNNSRITAINGYKIGNKVYLAATCN